MDTDKIARKIRALLSLAAGAAGTPEGDLAQQRADALMERYGVRPADAPSTRPVVRRFKPSNGALWRFLLAGAIEGYAHVSVLRCGRGASAEWAVVGTAEDYATWLALYLRASAEIDAEATRYVATLPRGLSARSEGDTWRKGAASGFGSRLALWAKQAAKPAPAGATSRSSPRSPARSLAPVGSASDREERATATRPVARSELRWESIADR